MSYETQPSGIVDHAFLQNMYEMGPSNGFVYGGVCTSDGTDMDTDYTAFGAVIDGTSVTVAGGSVTHDAADATNPRMDMVVCNSSGTVSIVKGSATAESTSQTRPPLGALPSGSVILCVVYITAGITAIPDANLFDRRVMVSAVTRRTTSNFTKNNNGSFSDVTGLSFPIGASQVWSFTVHAQASIGATPDIKLQFTAPSGAAATGNAMANSATGSVAIRVSNWLTSNAVTSTAADVGLILSGTVVNSTTAGTVQLQAAQNSATAEDTIIYAQSFIVARRVA